MTMRLKLHMNFVLRFIFILPSLIKPHIKRSVIHIVRIANLRFL